LRKCLNKKVNNLYASQNIGPGMEHVNTVNIANVDMEQTLVSYGMWTKYRVSSLGPRTSAATAASFLVQTPTKQLCSSKVSASLK
jgi:hypothetical protein